MTKTLCIFSIIVTCFSSWELHGQEQQNYPEFSWDKIPLYMHMRKSEAYTQAEFEYIASFPFICLEKTTGQDTYGSTEKGCLEAAKGIKAINPNAKILYYRNLIVHYQGMYAADSSLLLMDKPYLEDSEGNVNLHQNYRPLFDLSNEELQKWWVDHAVLMSNYDEIDGIFFDAIGKILHTSYMLGTIGAAKKQAVLEGYYKIMDECAIRMDSSKIKLGNLLVSNIPEQGLDNLHLYDGSYMEAFIGDAAWTADEISAAQTAARAGEIISIAFDMGLDDIETLPTRDGYIDAPDLVQDRFEYCLGLFLICAEEYSYFCFNDGYSVNPWTNNRLWMKRFKEYDKPLGPPLGPAVKTGYVYTREFEHASVWVDLAQGKGTVRWDTDPPPSNVKFVVKDTEGNNLPNAKVKIKSYTEDTNASGEAEFELDNGQYLVTFSKGGYFSLEQSYDFDKDTTITVELEFSLSSVQFNITEGDSYSRYPKVTLDGIVKQASSMGMVLFDEIEKNKTHSYSIEKEGMQTVSSSFLLIKDTTITVALSVAASARNVEGRKCLSVNSSNGQVIIKAQKEMGKVELVGMNGQILYTEEIEGMQHEIQLPQKITSIVLVKVVFKDQSVGIEKIVQL